MKTTATFKNVKTEKLGRKEFALVVSIHALKEHHECFVGLLKRFRMRVYAQLGQEAQSLTGASQFELMKSLLDLFSDGISGSRGI